MGQRCFLFLLPLVAAASRHGAASYRTQGDRKYERSKGTAAATTYLGGLHDLRVGLRAVQARVARERWERCAAQTHAAAM